MRVVPYKFVPDDRRAQDPYIDLRINHLTQEANHLQGSIPPNRATSETGSTESNENSNNRNLQSLIDRLKDVLGELNDLINKKGLQATGGSTNDLRLQSQNILSQIDLAQNVINFGGIHAAATPSTTPALNNANAAEARAARAMKLAMEMSDYGDGKKEEAIKEALALARAARFIRDTERAILSIAT